MLDEEIRSMARKVSNTFDVQFSREEELEHDFEVLEEAAGTGDMSYFGNFLERVEQIDAHDIVLEVTKDRKVYITFADSEDIYSLPHDFVQKGARV